MKKLPIAIYFHINAKLNHIEILDNSKVLKKTWNRKNSISEYVEMKEKRTLIFC